MVVIMELLTRYCIQTYSDSHRNVDRYDMKALGEMGEATAEIGTFPRTFWLVLTLSVREKIKLSILMYNI